MKKPLIAAAIAAFLLAASGSSAVTRPAVQPGQSWNAACLAASPGDVIPVAPGRHPSQSITCKKTAPGVTFQGSGKVVVGNAGASKNCLSVLGSYITVASIETSYYAANRQCGVAVGRGGAHHVTLRDVDAGTVFIAANDVQIIRGDWGPSVDQDTLISPRTCSVSDDSCMPQRILIDGAYFHDYRRDKLHMQCIAFYGGDDVTIRNSRFYNCAVFSIFVSGGSQLHFDRLTFENNVFERGPAAMSSHVKFSDHGATYKGVVMRNNRLIGDDLLVASRSASGYLFEGTAGPINVLGACSNCGAGVYRVGSSAVTIRAGSSAPPPPPPPGTNAAPVACFTRAPNPSRAGQSVLFDASCSADADGDALVYTWDVSPGGDGVYERTGKTTSYAYQSSGNKTARLRVNDGHGHVVTVSQTFPVNP